MQNYWSYFEDTYAKQWPNIQMNTAKDCVEKQNKLSVWK